MPFLVPRGPRLGLALILIAAACLAACGAASAPAAAPAGGVNDAAGDPARAPGGAEAPGAQPPIVGQSTGGSGGTGGTGSNGSTTGQYDISRPDLLIIKTGTLSLQVTAIDDALAGASGKIAALGGYVSGSDRKGDGDQVVATVTYRIPAAQWDQAVVALRGLATKVLAEQSQTQDVTGDVLDLGARITNLQATETALQAIMAKATKIDDVLAVQSQLTDVRGQIEQLSTQKKHLEDQAAYSTLTVAYSLKPPPAVEASQKQFDPGSEVDKASASLVDVLQAVATAGIWFGIVWLPVLLAFAIGLGIVLVVLRRVLPPRRPEVMPVPEA
ncbi:MAG TPA: DUF4349 domain-containing protein [Candidatus Limnocylindrales bacterium]